MLNSPKLAAIAVVVHEEQLLLVQRRNPPDAGLWGFPGGHVNLGETAFEAAARELLEETGVTAQPLRYLTNIDVIGVCDNQVEFHYLLAAVLCRFERGAPKAMDDALDARWVPVKDVLSGALEMSEKVDDVLRLALECGAGS